VGYARYLLNKNEQVEDRHGGEKKFVLLKIYTALTVIALSLCSALHRRFFLHE
jgi:hypothetical protein